MRVTAYPLSEMISYLYLSMSSKKQIFLIRNESPRPVWWFVILAWIIMVWSDDKSYCLVSSYIEHCLNYHSDRGRVGLHWPGQTRAEHRASWSKFTGKWSKKYPVQDFEDLREAIYHISELSGIRKIIQPCRWYHHTLYFKSYRIYQARYPVTHVTQAAKLPGIPRHWTRDLKASWTGLSGARPG